jgi:predicted amino acid racemase
MRAKVTVNIPKIKQNAAIIIDKCAQYGIEISAVTKMHCADVKIASALVESGIKILADSRIENLIKLQNISCEKWLIRIPAPSLAQAAVHYADVTLNSEISVIRKLDEAARNAGKKHKVILMFDLGDLREGYFDESTFFSAAEETLRLKNIELYGIGTNLSCYGGIMPTPGNLSRLASLARALEDKFSIRLNYVSGGSSTSYTLVNDGNMPAGINNLRIGDTFYFGRDMSRRTYIDGMQHDCMVLSCEIAEIKTKPSVPIGTSGFASLNRKPQFTDKGPRKRAICSVGRQDADLDMIPHDPKIEIMEASSDHLLVDITQSDTDYKVGDVLTFNMLYTSCLRAFTSPYIDKEYIL